jgi:hypothetical protein
MYFQAQAAKPAPARRAPARTCQEGPAPTPNRRAPAKKPLLARHQVLEQGHPFSRTASSAPCSLTTAAALVPHRSVGCLGLIAYFFSSHVMKWLVIDAQCCTVYELIS